ncbi:hypothetical protein GCM10009867_00220 [Pedococcus aerophilus]|uniref:Uncharacterized protein n=1 Tax=Pedococcus aerophilus TaxID=436356 RepID=A0ABN3UBZ2_9MICO
METAVALPAPAVADVLDCVLKLPFDQALAVADSALRAIALGVRALRFTPQLVAELTGTPAPPQPQEERRAVPA